MSKMRNVIEIKFNVGYYEETYACYVYSDLRLDIVSINDRL